MKVLEQLIPCTQKQVGRHQGQKDAEQPFKEDGRAQERHDEWGGCNRADLGAVSARDPEDRA